MLQAGFNKEDLCELFFPLPSTIEQQRIVAHIEKLYKQIDIIDENQNDIETLYEDLKKRTLDLAIQGKLVTQDENDEPASVLLEKIRAEKKAQLGKNMSIVISIKVMITVIMRRLQIMDLFCLIICRLIYQIRGSGQD